MLTRLAAALTWRWEAWTDTMRDALYHALGARGGAHFIRWRWPFGITKPYHRRRLLLRAPGVGIGDNLMVTPILREIKRRNPACEITMLTMHPDLFRDNPHVDHVVSPFDPAERDALILRYDHMAPRRLSGAPLPSAADGSDRFRGYVHPTPPPRPLITIMAENVGLELHATQLDCAPPEVSPVFRERVTAIAAPFVVVQPEASAWTPLKNWPVDRWVEVVHALLLECTVVEVGTSSVLAEHIHDPRFVSLAGHSSVAEMMYLISKATIFAGPDSAGMHVANAFHVPSVIVFGGYSSPEMFRYPRTRALVGATECAPCMLTTPCPFSRKCLSMITVADVTSAIRATLAECLPPPATH
jgi:ADP-heptose:LPS heptosyltransferase